MFKSKLKLLAICFTLVLVQAVNTKGWAQYFEMEGPSYVCPGTTSSYIGYIDYVVQCQTVTQVILLRQVSPGTQPTIQAGKVVWGSAIGDYKIVMSCGVDDGFSVSVVPNEIMYPISGNGKICTPGGSALIGLDNSQLGIIYFLKRMYNGEEDWTFENRNGTGAPVKWSVTQPGEYTVFATEGCQYWYVGNTQGYGNPVQLPGSVMVSANTTQPSDLAVKASGPFCENAKGTVYMPASEPGISYQLLRNDGHVEGATLTGTGGEIKWSAINVPPGSWTYSVTASNGGCLPRTMSSTVTLTVPTNVISTLYGGGTHCAGQDYQSVDLDITQEGVMYHLYRDGVFVSSKPGTGDFMDWSSLGTPGVYTVKAGDANRTCLWDMKGSVAIVDGSVVSITSSVQDKFCLGTPVLLQTPNLQDMTYQWKKDGQDILYATEPTFEVIEGGTYQLVNGCGAVSNTITLTALPSPPFDLFFNDEYEFCEGGSILLKCTREQDYTYQWQRNGLPIGGATNYDFVLSETGLYEVNITAPNNCSTLSEGFPAKMIPTPDVYVLASDDAAICEGESITLHTAEKAGYMYQWKKDNVAITDGIGSTYSTTQKGFYSVTATQQSCTATSDLFEISIKPLPASISDITGEAVPEEGKPMMYSIVGVPDATKFIWSIPMDASLTSSDPLQRIVNIHFSTEGEEVIKGYAEKDGCLSAAFEKNVRVRPHLITPTGIPDEVKINREGKQLLPIERQFLVKDLSIGIDKQVFQAPPCLDGQYYVGVQLYYDLGDQKTVQDWSSTLTVGFMRGDDTLWEEPLKVDMASQTFIATIFHDKLISCIDNYHIVIRNKTNTGVVPEENIYLKILLYKHAVDVFNPSPSFSFNSSYSATDGQTLLTWNYTGKAALSYDLEWVFIDSYENFTGNTVQDAFKFKAPIGISTAGQAYKHLTYYPKGKLWYRIRAIGYNPQYPDHRILGQWYYNPTAIAIDNHEKNKTWQQQTVFAEEGKYKKVIHYFDGSLRQRQSQTNLSTENVTLVAESLYDFEGRMAGDILAVPATEATLTYKPAFNRFVASDPLIASATSATRKKFHYDNRRLENSILSNTTGAARYYSAANGNESIHKNYIPDAEGYVYSQAEYLNDGTGRITRQSGVGKTFKMDGDSKTNHTIKNYYGEATTPELVRLFGSNVGVTTHYKKNITVDANGQVSVSYLDQEGAVIATALAGKPPENVEALKSYTDLSPDLIMTDITDKNKITSDKSETIHKLLNVYSTSYTFSYNLSTLVSPAGCQSCVFDLKITLTDPDGKLVHLGTIAGNESDGYAYERKNLTAANCNATPLNAVSFTLILPVIGDYTITKTLTPHDRTFEDIREMVSQNASVQQQIQAIRNSYVLDDADCAICTSCPEAQTAINEAIDDVATQDCENILNKIRNELSQAHLNDDEYEPSQAEIEAHPLYCRYALCDKDKQSDAFEKQLSRVENWTKALSTGYSNLVENDPFFNNPALSGYTFKSTMQTKLKNILITDQAPYRGTIDQVTDTDPNIKTYYIDANGDHDVNGYHILYFDLMKKQSQTPDPDYASKLNAMRWSMYKSFYLEAKRKVKLSIQAYQTCDSARVELQRNDQLPTTESGIAAWGDQHGVPGVVSNEELEMAIYSIKSACKIIKMAAPDSTSMGGYLKAYFDGDKKNFFRVILKNDLGVNASLISLQTLLNNKYSGCKLDSVAVPDPIVCSESITPSVSTYSPNLIANPTFMESYPGSPNCGLNATITQCNGWKAVSGTPYLKLEQNAEAKAVFKLKAANCIQDALIGTFRKNGAPYSLRTDKSYRLKFKYKFKDKKGIAFIKLSRSEAFNENVPSARTALASSANSVNISPCWQDAIPPSVPTNLTVTSMVANSLTLSWSPSTDNCSSVAYEIFMNGQSRGTQNSTCVQIQSLTPSTTYVFKVKAFDSNLNYSAFSQPITVTTPSAPLRIFCSVKDVAAPDRVKLEGNNFLQDIVWQHSSPWECMPTPTPADTDTGSDNDIYETVTIDFTPSQASTYIFFYIYGGDNLMSPSITFKDVELREGINTVFPPVCTKYAVENPINWVKAAEDSCKLHAAQEREYLIQYATENFLESKVTEFHNTYRTNCLAHASESLKYQYAPKEYHYTLYYHDQAKNLVQTVPPEGVKPLTTAQVNAFMTGTKTEPAHTLITRYHYRSLNQVMDQNTPDAGKSQFWYNNKGQLRMSQNAQQAIDKKYSYTKYDEQGRIAEVGELYTTEAAKDLMVKLESSTFPESNLYTLADITRTHYDKPNEEIQSYFVQRYLRSRVSWVEVIDKDATDITLTYYSYDIHGNVKSLLQRLPGLGLKRTDYQYDLISGKVNYVFYQYGEPDQFIHKYTYDADNRITSVNTSTDGFIWDKEARYQYYLHGPLARTELGEYRVQAQDYFYTLQGWIKGVNMPFAGDPGQDGTNSSKVGKDAYAYSLGYYNGDYKPINNTVLLSDTRDQLWPRLQETFPVTKVTDPPYTGLYNGNIAWMVTDLTKIGEVNNNRTKGMQAMVYKYDQLNRITRSRSLTTYSSGGTIPQGFMQRNPTTPAPYDEDYSYDGNGNILTLKRMNEQGALLDDFNYQYYSQTNKLKVVELISEDKVYSSGPVVSNTKLYKNITVNGTAYIPSGANVVLRATDNITVSPEVKASDAEFNAYITEDPGNYRYDAIGNLIADVKSETTITWTPYGKIREVQVGDTTKISFRYDATGNRVEKRLQRPHGTTVTRYVRDAGGNVMGVYLNAILTEQPIYGSSRLGQYTGGRKEGYRTLGEKKYELSNHLGNVLTVISDNVGMDQGNVWAKVESANDYYPFGMLMKGRSYSSEKYRYGFNGKEMDNEVGGDGNQYDYGFRIYNPRIARFLSVDPLTISYPWYTPYQFAGNSPIANLDLDGREEYYYKLKIDKETGKPILTHVKTVETKSFLGITWVPSETIIIEYEGTDPEDYSETFEFTDTDRLKQTNSFENLNAWIADPTSYTWESGNIMTFDQIFWSNEALILGHLNNGLGMAAGATIGLSTPSKAPAVSKNTSIPKPKVAYNRGKDYGKTPTKADRKALGAKSDEDIDHKIPLVKHYYEGDGKGGKPGYLLTRQQRKDFAKDRSNMEVVKASKNRSDGGKLSQYSKNKKKEHGL